MSPDLLKKAKYLFVVYPGGCGGNHLANMLSLCDEFKSTSSYEQLLKQYKKIDIFFSNTTNPNIKAHFSDIHLVQNLEDTDYRNKIIDEQNNEINIFIGHHQHYFMDESKDFVKYFDDKIWIVFSFPNTDSIPHKRLIKSEYYPCHIEHYMWPYKTYISDSYYHSADDSNGFYFDTEKFFTAEGCQYLREMLLSNFGVILPETADILHSMWYKWMEYVASK